MSFYVLYSLHKHCTFLNSSILYNSAEKLCFVPWMNLILNESCEPVIQRSNQMDSLVSFFIESAVLNESFDFNYWINHLLKQGQFYCHIYSWQV